jgi:hypothetical protein
MLPDGHTPRFIVAFLLHLVQQVLALDVVTLSCLLVVPGVNLGILNPGLRAVPSRDAETI